MQDKTVGAVALELQNDLYPQDVIETQREMQKDHVEELMYCAKRHEKIFGSDNAYYVCVQLKRERLLTNVIRSYFYARRTRPIPDYDLSLYHYDPKTEQLTFVWAIPDKETVEYILENKHLLPLDHEQLIHFCISFKENTLV